jgi:thiamine biosynthesis lipoprotein
MECADPAVAAGGGLELDFCGIAKGFAVDWAVQAAGGWLHGHARNWRRAAQLGAAP